MNLTINNYNGLNLLVAEGTVEENEFKTIADELEKLPATAEKFVLLDCAGIRKLINSSMGISGFINQLLILKSKNVRITLYGCDQQMQNLLKLLKLENSFNFSSTLDEAYINLNQVFRATPATSTAAS